MKISVTQAIGTLANIGVLGGIVLLVLELSQTQEIVRAQTRTDVSQGAIDVLNSRADTAELWTRAATVQGYRDLSDADQFRLNNLASAEIRYHQNVYYQYKLGLYDEAEFEAQRNALRNAYSNRVVAFNFCGSRSMLSPDFVAEIERLLTVWDCEDAARFVAGRPTAN